jgi:hypothetical protein
VFLEKWAQFKNDIPVKKIFKYVEINQPKSFKRKMRGRKLRSGVDWHGLLKQEGLK